MHEVRKSVVDLARGTGKGSSKAAGWSREWAVWRTGSPANKYEHSSEEKLGMGI